MMDSKCSLTFLILVTIFLYGKGQTPIPNHCVDQVPCDNNYQCIARKNWCDKEIDCNDGSDEKYCETKSWYQLGHSNINTCNPEKHFICWNGPCVPKATVCDGYKNCYDGSDEDCIQTTTSYSSSTEDDPFDPLPTLKPFSSEEDSSETTTLLPFDITTHHTATTTTPSTTQRPPRAPWTSTIIDYYANRRTEDTNQFRTPAYNKRQYGLHVNGVHPQYSPERSVHSVVPPINSFKADYGTPRSTRDSYSQQQTSRQTAVRPPRRHPEAGTRTYTHIEDYPSYNQQTFSDSGDNNGVLTPFYFQRNYTDEFEDNYRYVIQKAAQWLLDRRDRSYGWGRDTPRALVALSLISNSFSINITENNLMKKSLEAHLGLQLLNRKNKPLSLSRLALYINALLATCQNPRNFLGIDVTAILLDEWRKTRIPEERSNPLVYLSLCLTNSSLTTYDLNHLYDLLNPRNPDEKSKDRQILATTAIACFQHQDVYNPELRSRVDDAFNNLLRRMRYEERFGSTYSKALAAQALMSINSSSWDPENTLDYLAAQQADDGSFGDMLATYYILPALSGRSLVHLRNTRCDPPPPPEATPIFVPPGPKITIKYTLKVGRPERFTTSMDLRIPKDIDFFSAMLAAQQQNPQFRFQFSKPNGDVDVHTIMDIPNDVERGYRWHLYIRNSKDRPSHVQREHTESLLDLQPRDKEEFVYWYFR